MDRCPVISWQCVEKFGEGPSHEGGDEQEGRGCQDRHQYCQDALEEGFHGLIFMASEVVDVSDSVSVLVLPDPVEGGTSPAGGGHEDDEFVHWEDLEIF